MRFTCWCGHVAEGGIQFHCACGLHTKIQAKRCYGCGARIVLGNPEPIPVTLRRSQHRDHRDRAVAS